MPDTNASGTISLEQYQTYAAAWTELIASGNQDALTQAFQLPEVARLNFLTFSISQITALVAAKNAHIIKARFLLMPEAIAGQSRFSATLFAADADNQPVSAYYVPAQAPADKPTDATGPAAADDSPKLPREEALRWLTDWVNAPSLLPAFFISSHGPMHGYNYELSTFTDPLAAAPPYDGKVLFLNLGLEPLPDGQASQLCNLVVYIGLLNSRTEGSVEGLPDDDPFYDHGLPCPPAALL